MPLPSTPRSAGGPFSKSGGREQARAFSRELSRNDAVECRAAFCRPAGFSNEIGTATSAGPTFTAGSGQLIREYSSDASIRLSVLTRCLLLCVVFPAITLFSFAANALPPPSTPTQDTAGSWDFRADPALPNVLLLGDSISIGYTRPVRTLLAGKANVYRASSPDGTKPSNCGDSRMGLAGLERWLGERKWAVIHFNWGLWDLCYRNPAVKTQGNRDKVGGKLPFPIEEYERNLDQIVTRLKTTGAVLIWASTTVVPEGEAGRVVGDDLKYNRVAAAVMAKHGVAINDLHTLTKSFAISEFVGPGDVHFSSNGSTKIATQVAATLESALQKQASSRKSR
jgi:hypothetical protein